MMGTASRVEASYIQGILDPYRTRALEIIPPANNAVQNIGGFRPNRHRYYNLHLSNGEKTTRKCSTDECGVTY